MTASAERPIADPPSHRPRVWLIVLGVALFAGVVAAVTNQAWDDYYITFRSSRNLVEGHGLVFQPGERVHTFTSPLGVLVPALGLWITGRDGGALWFLRLLSIAALAGTAALVLGRLRWRGAAVAAALTLAVLDSKTLSFATNGMETGLFLFFVALVWHELSAPELTRFLPLAAGFAGLMWTRPDGFIPALAMTGGLWWFVIRTEPPHSRQRWRRRLVLGALLGGALYAPWFFWAWSYYGSPVPNTIVAKSAIAPGTFSLGRLLLAPLECLIGPTSLDGLFAPTFFIPQDWPRVLGLAWRLLGRVAAFAWLLPGVPRPARAASLATLAGGVYFQNIVVFSWYYAPWTLLGGVALGGVVEALLKFRATWQPAVRIVTATIVLMVLGVAAAAVQTGRMHHRYDEENVRQAMGLWLHEHAAPQDTVFLEPLGYLGYFSGLKMLDFPGLSAPEVTRLVRAGHRNYGELIDILKPTWLVLRPTDVADHHLHENSRLRDYGFVRSWDQQAQLDAVRFLPSRSALDYDAVFLLFKRRPEAPK